MKPTYEEFLSELTEEHGEVETKARWKDFKGYGGVFSRMLNLPFEDDEPFLYYSWSDGGMSGGSCWGHTAEPYPGVPEPDDNLFTRILEKHGQHITYMQFRKMNRELLHEFSYCDREYYGNHSNYKAKAFSIKELYNALYGD